MLNPHTKLRRIMLEEKIMLKRADEKVEVSAEKNRDGIRSIKNALFQKKNEVMPFGFLASKDSYHQPSNSSCAFHSLKY